MIRKVQSDYKTSTKAQSIFKTSPMAKESESTGQVSIKATFEMTNCMDTVGGYTGREASGTTGATETAGCMVTVFTFGQTVVSTKANSSMTSGEARAPSLGQMETSMKVSSKMVI